MYVTGRRGVADPVQYICMYICIYILDKDQKSSRLSHILRLDVWTNALTSATNRPGDTKCSIDVYIDHTQIACISNVECHIRIDKQT